MPDDLTEQMDKSKVVEFWDRAAKDADRGCGSQAGMLAGNPLLAQYRQTSEERHFLKIVSLTPKMDVLEVGAGGGRWSFFLADKVRSVVGLDISREMVELSRSEMIARRVSNVSFAHMDFLTYPTDRTFDVIYFSGVLQYCTDNEVAASIEKARTLLSQNGVIISRDTIQARERVTLTGRYPVIYRTVEEYRRLFGAGGFELRYSAPSYKPKRFTSLCSRLYHPPVLPYWLALSVLLVLNLLNDAIGRPRFLMRAADRNQPQSDNLRQHCFFNYQKVQLERQSRED